jgi:hypothetical protein
MRIIILLTLALIMACSKDNVLTPPDRDTSRDTTTTKSRDTTPPAVVGIYGNGGSLSFVKVNSQTGEMLLSVSRPELDGYVLGNSAVDTSGERYFVLGGVDRRKLFTLDTRTGAIIASPDIELNVNEIEYEPSTGKLVGVRWVNGMAEMVRIDPSTGTTTGFASLPGVYSIQQGGSSFDPATDRYFLTVADSLLTIDTRTGAIIAGHSIDGIGMSNAQFEPASGKVVALTYRTRIEEFIRINPISGEVVSGGMIPEVQTIVQGEATINARTGRLIFMGSDSLDRRLYSVTLATGAVAARPLMSNMGAIEVLR